MNNLPKKIQQALTEADVVIGVGDIYIRRDMERGYHSSVIRVSDIVDDKYGSHIKTEYPKNWECTKWSQGSSFNVKDWKSIMSEYIKVSGDLSSVLEDGKKLLDGEINLDSYKNNSEIDTGTALVGRASKESLLIIKSDMESAQEKAALAKSAMGFEIDRRKAELEAKLNEMRAIMLDFREKLTKIVKIITSIELYLGIDEELVQIQDGERALATTLISFRQMVLYWDEEVGTWLNGGLDYNNSETFDVWLTTNRNFEKVIPEKKGVVVFNPRRSKKDYGDDVIVSSSKNEANLRDTYILIRNGECIYRIFTEKLHIQHRLFPRRTELSDMLDGFEKRMSESHFFEREKKEQEEKFEDVTYQYRKQALLLQGLFDRTDVFQPTEQKISIFHLDKTPDAVNFIYDDEISLPTGRKPFWEWWLEVNQTIEHGSRVLLTGEYAASHGRSYFSSNRDGDDSRFFGTQRSRHRVPDYPHAGIYEVETYIEESVQSFGTLKEVEVTEYDFKKSERIVLATYPSELVRWQEKNKNIKHEILWDTLRESGNNSEKYVEVKIYMPYLTVMFNNKDEAHSGWGDWSGHIRKNRIRFKIEPTDRFLINYDQLEIADLEFYMNSRTDRKDYAVMLPILERVRDFLLQEHENEKPFVDLMTNNAIQKLGLPITDFDVVKEQIWKSVEWWKFKNKIKRALNKDESKAFRMIEKHTIKELL